MTASGKALAKTWGLLVLMAVIYWYMPAAETWLQANTALNHTLIELAGILLAVVLAVLVIFAMFKGLAAMALEYYEDL